MTGKQIKNVATKVQHDTLQRWGVSYDRFAELIEQMDSVYPSYKRQKCPLSEAIAYLSNKLEIDQREAMVLIQLYVVMRNKLDTLLN